MLLLLTHIASVDAYQHWIYTSRDGADRDARDAAWLRIRERFQPGLDWSGLEGEHVARWYFQLHFFLHPFYYVEYGLAQLGALQVWRNSRASRIEGRSGSHYRRDELVLIPFVETYRGSLSQASRALSSSSSRRLP